MEKLHAIRDVGMDSLTRLWNVIQTENPHAEIISIQCVPTGMTTWYYLFYKERSA